MINITPNSEFAAYFAEHSNSLHKQYLALRSFFHYGHTAEQVANEFGYSVGTVYAMVRDFKAKFNLCCEDPFFKVNKAGRKPIDQQGEIEKLVIEYRKKYLSVPDIKIALDSLGYNVSEGYVYGVVHNAGFDRLPRRGKTAKDDTLSSMASTTTAVAPVAKQLAFDDETFSSQLAGLLCMLPVIAHYGIHDIINESSYPQTSDINRLSSIMSFVALKL